MKTILKWLRELEHLASEAYALGVPLYSNDPEFQNFLKQSAEDEAWHYHVIGSVSEFMSSIPEITPAVVIDQETSDRIFNYLSEIKTGIEEQSLDKDELIEKIVRLELSEWNDIFLYVVNLLKEKTSEFKYPAAKIQSHLRGIENYISTIEANPKLLEKIKEVPSVWIEKILIVDDEKSITKLLKSLLNRDGDIDIAHDGFEALKMLDSAFYKLIISDVNMPLMNGIDFYKNAVKKYPTSSGRFLFMTGNPSPEVTSFFNQNHIPFLSKPMNIAEFRKIAKSIILS